MSRIHKLQELGQSIWLDYIERGMLRSGELGELVAEGIAGVTSNPTIFQQAISGSSEYADDLQQLVSGGGDSKVIFEQLAIADIQAAADVLRPVYDAADRQDGYVSIEVAPDLAYMAGETIAEARRLFSSVNRPNVMIKVPATKEGIPAIRQLIEEGINVNVTLIFSLTRYAAVKEAYLAGLEARLDAGNAIDHVASVASFFVSRVDSNVDAQLTALAKDNAARADEFQSLMGQIAVANAKLAYRQFEEVFSGARWERLLGAGGQYQRPLWASTSTKNPDYPELLYVETLIGPHTVNTMPPKTLDAFRAKGVVERTVDQDVDGAKQVFAALEAIGVDVSDVTADLEKEGVQKFADSYDELLATIEQQRQEAASAD